MRKYDKNLSAGYKKLKPYDKSLKPRSRQLRHDMTDAEQLLWKYLRRNQIHQARFNRQKPLLNYIVDFYCAKANLIIELDGSQHYEPGYKKKDNARDRELSQLGLYILRFDNNQVLSETENVVRVIYDAVGKQLGIPPNTTFTKGGI